MTNLVTWHPGMTLRDLRREVLAAAFKYHFGDKAAVAKTLGVNVRTVNNWLSEHKAIEDAAAENATKARQQREEFLARQRGVPAGAQYDNGAVLSHHDPRKK